MRFLLLVLVLTAAQACPPGARGPPGNDGERGFNGTEGPRGLQGPPGTAAVQNSTFAHGIRVIGTATIDDCDLGSLTAVSIVGTSFTTTTSHVTGTATVDTLDVTTLAVSTTSSFGGHVLITNSDDISWQSTYNQPPALKVDGGVAVEKDLAVYGDVLLGPASVLGVGAGLFFGGGPTGSAPRINIVNLQLSDTQLMTMNGDPLFDLTILPTSQVGQWYTLIGGTMTQGFAGSAFVMNNTCDFQMNLYKNRNRITIATGMSYAWFTAGMSRVVTPSFSPGEDFALSDMTQTSLTFGPTGNCRVTSGNGSVNVMLVYMVGAG